jgi:hypothetical protein
MYPIVTTQYGFSFGSKPCLAHDTLCEVKYAFFIHFNGKHMWYIIMYTSVVHVSAIGGFSKSVLTYIEIIFIYSIIGNVDYAIHQWCHKH